MNYLILFFSKTMKRQQNFTNVSSHLPEFNYLNRGSIILEYLPTLHTICKAESLRKAARVKRRFVSVYSCFSVSTIRVKTIQWGWFVRFIQTNFLSMAYSVGRLWSARQVYLPCRLEICSFPYSVPSANEILSFDTPSFGKFSISLQMLALQIVH